MLNTWTRLVQIESVGDRAPMLGWGTLGRGLVRDELEQVLHPSVASDPASSTSFVLLHVASVKNNPHARAVPSRQIRGTKGSS